MARTQHSTRINIDVHPKRGDAPDLPIKVLVNAVEKGKQVIKEEIHKYYKIEGQEAEVTVK